MSRSNEKLSKYDSNMAPAQKAEGDISWIDVKENPNLLYGAPFFETDKIFRRMPVNPPAPLTEAVDALAWNTAGLQIRFRSDSPNIYLRAKLMGGHTMDHMPSTGQCGFDLYLGDDDKLRYGYTTRTGLESLPDIDVTLASTLIPQRMRNFTINFPLYQGVEEVSFGVDKGAEVMPALPFANKGKIVVYGTSITQGGCASRPGMAYTNILSRRLQYEFVNMGFSGSGRGEKEVAESVAAVADPALFVLDYEANTSGTGMMDTLPEFVGKIRNNHSEIPILVVSKIRYANTAHMPEAEKTFREHAKAEEKLVQQLSTEGDKNLHFFNGSELLGEDFDECTVDGVHPTDLGFMRMAEGFEPVINSVLNS